MELNNFDFKQAVKERHSWEVFSTTKHPELVEAMHSTHTAFDTALKAAEGPEKDAINALNDSFTQARTEMARQADLGKNGWVKKEGVADDVFNNAKKAYGEASQSYEKFLSGKEKVGEVGVSKELQKAFEAAHGAVGKVKEVLNSPLGMVKVHGYKEAAKQNLNSMKFWDKEVKAASKSTVAFRSVGLAAAGAAISDSLLRSKDKEGEDRSFITRGAELLAGVGIGSAAVLAGHAI